MHLDFRIFLHSSRLLVVPKLEFQKSYKDLHPILGYWYWRALSEMHLTHQSRDFRSVSITAMNLLFLPLHYHHVILTLLRALVENFWLSAKQKQFLLNRFQIIWRPCLFWVHCPWAIWSWGLKNKRQGANHIFRAGHLCNRAQQSVFRQFPQTWNRTIQLHDEVPSKIFRNYNIKNEKNISIALECVSKEKSMPCRYFCPTQLSFHVD